jgi:hypothetical protein
MLRLTVFSVAVLWVAFCSNATATAQSDYFVNAFAGSPLAYYLGGDVSTSTSAVETSTTDYTDGINDFLSSGNSAVSLSTGTLHSAASADYGYDPGSLPNDPTDQFGNSSFGDGLTFLGNFTGQLATFNVSVDGTWSGDTPAFNGSDFQFMVLPTGTISANSGNTLNIFNNPGNVAIVNDTYSLTSTSPNLSFNVSVPLNGLNPSFEFAANLNINPFSSLGQTFNADYSNTASISLQAPPGVTVFSSSGVFPGTVPEPGSMSLSIAGLVSLALLARFRSRRGQVEISSDSLRSAPEDRSPRLPSRIS